MTASERYQVRLELERAGTPMDAWGFGLIERDCARCSEPWWSCICDPTRPRRQPTLEEIEAAREERLARVERVP